MHLLTHELEAKARICVIKKNSFYDFAIRRFKRNKLAVIGGFITLFFVVVAIFAPIIAPHEPSEFFFIEGQNVYNKYASPSSDHLLGTDSLGRDVFSRLVYGARVTMMVALLAVSISTLIGTFIGLITGYFGKIIDAVFMRIVDIVISFPVLFLLISISTIMDPSIWIVILAIGFVSWTSTARLVRAEVLRVKELDYILASHAVGSKNMKIILKHILPNILAPIMVQITIGTAQAILMEASLSFLGVGIQQPTPSWGNMLMDAQKLLVLRDMPWIWIPPGIVNLLLVLAIYFVGDGLRDAFDSRQ
ncbi:MAG: ABC transporter permease [Spirochaetia bacterium]|nr:ABC transporter permease [Spirochaetia bacterium]